MQVKYMDPNDYDDDISGHYDCMDGAFLDVVVEEGTGIYDVVVTGIDAITNEAFLFTSYALDINGAIRKIKRCTG